MSKAKENFGHIASAMTAMAESCVHTAQMAKAAQAECEEGSDEHARFGKTGEIHTNAAEQCIKCVKALSESSKTDGDELDKIMPMNISRVTPTPPNIRMVPRAGQQQLPTPQENPVFTEIFGSSQEPQQ